ncbi:MAG: ABC transporter permease [Acidobacteria bacterium]|nr:ABC transporter permease [Acidobacteriota bacterium]
MGTILQDLRFGARMLLKKPGFTLIAVVTLALGIGANTAIFSVADKLLLRPLPVKDPGRLALVGGESVNPRFPNTIFSYPNYVDYRDQNEVFSVLLAFIQIDVKLGAGEQASKIGIELVSGNYFDTLGVAAAQGRVIRDEDNRAEDGHPVAVISHSCWQRRFGGQPGVVGQNLQLNGASYTIIGVAPAHFTGIRLETPAEAWAPLMMRRQLLSATNSIFERNLAWLRLMGRLKPGVTMAKAQLSFDLTARRIWEANTSPSERKLPFNEKRILLEPVGQGMSSLRRSMGETLKLLLAIVGLLLVLACANVTNLLLARAAGRRKEIAVRLALGASRWQIIRQLLTESLLLACLGAGAGMMLAPWLYELLLAFQPSFVIERSTLQGSLDARVLGFTALTAVLSGVLFGLVPAWQSARADLIPALKDAEPSAAQGERRWNVRSALVVAQVALALVMLIGAGLLVRSLQRLFAIDPGFRAENLLIVPLDLPRAAYATARDEAGRRAVDESNNQYFAQLAERVKALPGVEAATTAALTPFSNIISKNGVVIEGWQPKPGENIAIDSNRVGPGYHEALGIPLAQGRGFSEQDNASAPRVVIINEAMARAYFPNQNPLGKRFSLGPGRPWLEIIGVTRDHRLHNLTETAFPHFDLPAFQHPYGVFARLVVRTKNDPLSALPAVRKEALALNAQVEIEAPTTLFDQVKNSIAAARMASTLTTVFGLTALLLAGVGLYGVMSYAVSRRTREIGIRLALGAGRGDVLRLMLKQGVLLTGLGLALGLLAAVSLTRMIKTLLYGVGATDTLTFVGVVLLLAGVALLACWIPARRATKVDPMVALKCE